MSNGIYEPREHMFRDPTSMNYRTQSLFWELSHQHGSDWVLYTLKPYDIEKEISGEIRKIRSLGRIYTAIADPTEYEFALACFESWDHWQRIVTKTGRLHEHIEKWRSELAVKLRSQGVLQMVELAKEEKGGQQAKWLAEGGWKPKTRGRPSKEEKEKALKEDKLVHAAVDEQFTRLMQ